MTAAWRMCLDAGMLANFPAFLIAKLGGRQNTSDMVLNPGTGTPIETNGQPISEIVGQLPYHEAGPGLMALIDKVTDQAKSVGASAEIPVGEGIQNIPVGTMLAHIEMATKLMAATHKLAHQAQDEERDHDREPAHEQRQRRRDQAPEDPEREQQQDREGERLRGGGSDSFAGAGHQCYSPLHGQTVHRILQSFDI